MQMEFTSFFYQEHAWALHTNIILQSENKERNRTHAYIKSRASLAQFRPYFNTRNTFHNQTENKIPIVFIAITHLIRSFINKPL